MRAFKQLAATLLLLAGCLSAANAQSTRELSGKVLDTAQQPLVGVAILVDGTHNGTVTLDDGTFSMMIPTGDVTVEVSSLGYITKKVNVPASRSNLVITLEEDNMTLDETVVVGYGTQKKVNLTGAITTVDTKELENRSDRKSVV